jgi:hypothetical protein
MASAAPPPVFACRFRGGNCAGAPFRWARAVACGYGLPVMCRNIRPLFNFDPPATEDEVVAAAVQFVRKLSGFSKPSQQNQRVFDRAVQEIAKSATRLIADLETEAPAKNREVEAEKRRVRSLARFSPQTARVLPKTKRGGGRAS